MIEMQTASDFLLMFDLSRRSDSKGTITSKELSEASALADSINKAIKVLETKNMIDEQSKWGDCKQNNLLDCCQELKYPRTS